LIKAIEQVSGMSYILTNIGMTSMFHLMLHQAGSFVIKTTGDEK